MTFPILPANGPSGYNLTRSLRFRRSAGGYLNRTASAGNQQIMTLSFWFKRGVLGVAQYIFGSYSSGSAYTNIYIESTDQIGLADAASATNLLSTQVFRDPSAWYHIVVAIDTTQATAANRVKFYVNNVQITAFASSTYPAQNTNLNLNSAVNHTLFNNAAPAATNYTDGYLAETNFVNASQLTPSSFGSTNTLTGVWQPARYTGTYGTNGFYLPFTDNSALTTSSNVGLGKDFSGNSNYWTTNNISITAGVTYDSMTDVPTLTSATAANFAVFNPLYIAGTTSVSDGNLSTTATTNTDYNVVGTIGITSGKFYWEMIPTTSAAVSAGGICQQLSYSQLTSFSGSLATAWIYNWDGLKWNNGTSTVYGATYTVNDVISTLFDADAGTITFWKNGVSQGTAFTGLTNGPYFPICTIFNGRTVVANFGQRPFAYTPPTGYASLNTFNLPTSTIVKGNTVMDATLYTGNSSTQTITNAGAFKPDFVWIKNRSIASQHVLTDSVRGVDKQLFSSNSNAEQTSATGITSLNSNGFSLGSNVGPTGDTNSSPNAFVGWQWQAGQGTTSSNTSGSITSTVSVNASAGFSVVTFTGNGLTSSGQTIGHGLGVAPAFIVTKKRSSGTTDYGWSSWHKDLGGNYGIWLNQTSARNPGMWAGYTNINSSVFSPPDLLYGNESGQTYVAYCWTPIAGYSAFGSYTGNGSSDGSFVYTGFRPRWVLIKRTDTAGFPWWLLDTARNTYNVADIGLLANSSDSESSAGFPYSTLDFVSNGFKLRATAGGVNASGGTYIYMAFAENPFKNALAR